MVQLVPSAHKTLLGGANSLLPACASTTDAIFDALTVASRMLASFVVARRGLWLQAWHLDIHSKLIVSTYPFQGEKLVSDALAKILFETR